MTRDGECEWYQSIGLYFLYVSADEKKAAQKRFLLFKGPGSFKKLF